MQRSLNILLQKPLLLPPLDREFCPISLGNINYLKKANVTRGSVPFSIALERGAGCVSLYHTKILGPGSPFDEESVVYIERLVKFLLWQRGGWKLILAGPRQISDQVAKIYSKDGQRAFDVKLMEKVYSRPFVVEFVDKPESLPASREVAAAIGGNLNGCRIGFDLGASDYKISAVINGEAVFSQEITWNPTKESDPEYHFEKINSGLMTAAAHLPKVDAIGGSSAGIIVNNQVRVASLFRAVPEEIFDQKVKPIFQRLQEKWKVPFEVANDGDVTALAGAMSIQDNAFLGIAMGSSQAVGYINAEGQITGWLNELAFAPIDYQFNAHVDEWSGDRGCGVQYFSQQAVIRLAKAASITLPEGTLAEQLKFVQELHEKKDARAVRIFETIGIYLGYALAQYADMYSFKHVLILGRVTSGAGGDVILKKAREVLSKEFPELHASIKIHIPDEKMKRVGQAVAAASLPSIDSKESNEKPAASKPEIRTITLETEQHQAEVAKELYARLNAFNETVAGPLNSERLVLSIRDGAGKVIAGLSGESHWGALFISMLWVDQPFRKMGYARSLLEHAESIARKRSCRKVYLNTFTFQAPDFYMKCGYKLIGELTNVPPGHSRKWFAKVL